MKFVRVVFFGSVVCFFFFLIVEIYVGKFVRDSDDCIGTLCTYGKTKNRKLRSV